MKKNYFLFLLIFVAFINVHAINYMSAQNGNWTSPTTWTPLGVPIPGDIITINHNVILDTDFAYTFGSITVNSSGSLIQDATPRSIWVNGPNASLTNNGITTINALLLSIGSYSNTGDFNVKTFANFITANNTSTGVIMGVDSLYNDGTIINNGIVNVMTFLNDNTLNNFGTLKGLVTVVDSMFNAGTLLNDVGALLQADSATNTGIFTNNGVVNFNQYTNTGTFTNTNFLSFDDMTNTGTFTNQDSLIGSGSITNTGNLDNQVGGRIDLGVSFLNADPVSFNALFTANGRFVIGDSFYNFDNINGTTSGSIQVQDTSFNSGVMSGSFDFCDLTPPPSSPFVDINSGSIDPSITYCTVTSVNVNDLHSTISIYPNPTTGILNIESNENFTVDVYNVFGELIITSSASKIDISTYQNGIYFVLIKDETSSLLKQEKIVKH